MLTDNLSVKLEIEEIKKKAFKPFQKHRISI